MSVVFDRVEFDDQHTSATIYVDKAIYSPSAILRVSYWFSKDLYFLLEEHNDGLRVRVGLRSTSITLEQPKVKKIDDWLPDIFNAFVDSQLRVEIQSETAAVRELIIAKAFAEAGVLEDLPPGTSEDSVGINHPDAVALVRISSKPIE
jgi:His-Xaa-Ser system protein HxsD